MPTALDIVTAALQEINAIAQGEPAQPGDANFGLSKLNLLLDEWAARKVMLYDVSLPSYALTAGLSPHTIGPMVQVTSSVLNNNIATYTAINAFSNGTNVTVFNSTNGLSTTGRAQSVTATQFSIAYAHANVAAAPDSAHAIIAGTTAPTFATPNLGQRPQLIEQASIILTDSNPVTDLPLNIRDENWWMSNRVKNLQSSIPTDLYYDPNWPNGSLYFWPVPSFSYSVRLKLWGVLGQLPNLAYSFSLPPGYQNAITMTLARMMVGSFQGSWGPQQEDTWKRAMKAVIVNNDQASPSVTADAGMPGVNLGGGFNWLTGMPA